MSEQTFLTREGLKKLEEELNHLRTVRRAEVAERLHNAQEDGRPDAAGNAEGNGTHQVSRHTGVGRCLRGKQPFRIPLPEGLGMLGLAFGFRPGQKTGGALTHGRQNAEKSVRSFLAASSPALCPITASGTTPQLIHSLARA